MICAVCWPATRLKSVPERLVITPGRRFGRLVVVREGPGQQVKGKPYRRRTLVCRCDCGSPDVEVQLYCLTSGVTKSCGCLRREVAPSRARARAAAPKIPKSPREQELSRRPAPWLAARVVELEEDKRRLTAELGAAMTELAMERGQYR